jgi:deoxyribodipyrimidine photo-lyase
MDADWASNALSWQWIAGSNSRKKYYANQANINKYCYTSQKGTFLDFGYDDLTKNEIPMVLRKTVIPDLKTTLPVEKAITIDSEKPLLIYNMYNLDPNWRKDVKANRILLLEPSHFLQYPVSGNTIDFICKLAKNISDIQVFTGEYDDLMTIANNSDNIYFKEHPFNRHYQGNEDPRDWMFNVKGYFPSFFAYWKICRKSLSSG